MLFPSRIVVLSVLCCTLFLPVRSAAEAPLTRVGNDQRVADAVRAWKEWVEFQAGVNNIPGMSVGIVYDQELIATGAFGFADPQTRRAATPRTLYSICSISKLFTSVAVMRQRDAGAVRLDDPVADHLGWFNLEDVHPDDGPITIRGLLTHSSGLPRESDYAYWTDPDYPFPTSEQIKARLGEQKTLYPASRYFQYSNLGLSLAGEIVADTSGLTFDRYIRTHILNPLGMNDTYTDIPTELCGSKMAIGYTARKRDGSRDIVAPFKARGIAPAAGFASNVPDLAKFAMWQFRLLGGGGSEILRASTLREMHRVNWVDPDWKTNWGLGFNVVHEADRTFVRHSGGCPGYYTEFRLEPKSKIGVIVLTNAIGSDVRTYAAKAFNLIAPEIKKATDAKESAPVRNPDLHRYVGIYDSIWGQTAVVGWGEGLAMLWLRTGDPKESLVELKHTGENTFRRIRKHEQGLGESIVFDVGENGIVRRFKQHSNWNIKVR